MAFNNLMERLNIDELDFCYCMHSKLELDHETLKVHSSLNKNRLKGNSFDCFASDDSLWGTQK